jgi:DNA-binding XRE family transcriptional regulator
VLREVSRQKIHDRIRPNERKSPWSIRLPLAHIACYHNVFDDSRTMLGYTAKDFAKEIGATPQAYSHPEGKGELSIDMAKSIRDLVPGMTLDWLYTAMKAVCQTTFATD